MAIRLITLIIIPLFCTFLRAQNNGIIQYNVVSLDTTMLKKNIKRFPSFSQIDKNYLKNNFVNIEFNDSIAKIVKNERREDYGLHAFESLYLGSQIEKYYFNHSKTVMTNAEQSNIFGKDEFIILKDFNNLWKLTDESKIIDGRKCYKAFIEETKKNTITLITAWYDPEISLSYGPKGYGGLPGLIIELTDNYCTLRLSKINFIDSNVKIEKPQKGKIITYEEYNKIFEDRMNYLKNELKKRAKVN